MNRQSKEFIPLDYRFVYERCYPCAMPGEGILSPTNRRIFAYMLSQSNVHHMTAYFFCPDILLSMLLE
jgi:hypothetical protein